MGDIQSLYESRSPLSAKFQRRADNSVVGGNSRGAANWSPFPLTFKSGSGARITDLDGNEYIDALNNYTSLIHGHAFPPVVSAVEGQLRHGTAWVGNNPMQIDLAEELISRVSSVDSIRFTNSGSEAGTLALTIARVVTGRPKVLMARYGYHGILLEYEVGSVPSLFNDVIGMTHLGTYNNAESFEEILAAYGHEIAAVVLEPVMGAGGVVSATEDFMQRVQSAARAAGALLVLDEVISYRLSTGGTQQLLGIEPDLTMFGKIIGGGFPVGAVGGRLDLMNIFNPKTPKAIHSGTFNANPVTMVAGLVALQYLPGETISHLNKAGDQLASRLVASAERRGLPLSVNKNGSLLNLFFLDEPPSFISHNRPDLNTAALFHLAAANHGLLVAGRGLVALSTAMDEEIIDQIVTRADLAMADVVKEMEGQV